MSGSYVILSDTISDNLASSILAGEGNPLPEFPVYYQNTMMYFGQSFGCSFISSLNDICELTHKHELCWDESTIWHKCDMNNERSKVLLKEMR